MKLPKIITDLVRAQDSFDSIGYANCFSEIGVVYDENKKHIGRKEIFEWIEDSNYKYNTVMKPISYDGDESKGVLKTKITGTFPGSPLLFTYKFEYDNDNSIQSLRISL